jgi:hypothetical protein
LRIKLGSAFNKSAQNLEELFRKKSTKTWKNFLGKSPQKLGKELGKGFLGALKI